MFENPSRAQKGRTSLRADLRGNIGIHGNSCPSWAKKSIPSLMTRQSLHRHTLDCTCRRGCISLSCSMRSLCTRPSLALPAVLMRVQSHHFPRAAPSFDATRLSSLLPLSAALLTPTVGGPPLFQPLCFFSTPQPLGALSAQAVVLVYSVINQSSAAIGVANTNLHQPRLELSAPIATAAPI